MSVWRLFVDSTDKEQLKSSCYEEERAMCLYLTSSPSSPLHLHRLLNVYPQSKIYFAHWPDLSYGSAPVVAHGKKVMGGVGLAVSRIDDLSKGLVDLSEQHAFTMRVDPVNFKVSEYRDTVYVPIILRVPVAAAAVTDMMHAFTHEWRWFCAQNMRYVLSSSLQLLSHCILVVVSSMFPKDFTPEAHCAFDKFLCALSLALSEKYR